MQFLANFVMRGQFQALIVTGILGVFSQAILPLAVLCCGFNALLLLRKGEKHAMPVILGVILLTVISSQFIETRPGMAFPLVVAILFPVVASALILRKTQSQGLAIALAVICAAGFAIAVQVYSGDAIQWWKNWLKLAVSGVQNTTFEGFDGSSALNVMNGMVAMMLGFTTISSVLLGRWLQASLFQPGGFKQEFHSIRIPKLFLILIIFTLVVMLVINENLFMDLLIVFSVAYFFQGLSVLHYNVDQLGRSVYYLLPPYILMVFVPQFVVIGLAGLGLVDALINFRKLPN